jgi:hypothetical protein
VCGLGGNVVIDGQRGNDGGPGLDRASEDKLDRVTRVERPF